MWWADPIGKPLPHVPTDSHPGLSVGYELDCMLLAGGDPTGEIDPLWCRPTYCEVCRMECTTDRFGKNRKCKEVCRKEMACRSECSDSSGDNRRARRAQELAAQRAEKQLRAEGRKKARARKARCREEERRMRGY